MCSKNGIVNIGYKIHLHKVTKLLHLHRFPIYIYKVRAYKNIKRNKEANKLLAKQGIPNHVKEITKQYKNAHSSLSWLHNAIPQNLQNPCKEPFGIFENI